MTKKIELSDIYGHSNSNAMVVLMAIEKYNSNEVSYFQLKVVLESAIDRCLSDSEMEQITKKE